jgi:hypothetical protein
MTPPRAQKEMLAEGQWTWGTARGMSIIEASKISSGRGRQSMMGWGCGRKHPLAREQFDTG